jgi:hypothetical protein
MVHLIMDDCETLLQFGDRHVPSTVISITVSLLLGKVCLKSPVKCIIVCRARWMGIAKRPLVLAEFNLSKVYHCGRREGLKA